jgi:hypothetical protein
MTPAQMQVPQILQNLERRHLRRQLQTRASRLVVIFRLFLICASLARLVSGKPIPQQKWAMKAILKM